MCTTGAREQGGMVWKQGTLTMIPQSNLERKEAAGGKAKRRMVESVWCNF
jgi:hypothetical protein